MSPRDVTDGVCHSEDGETEGDRYADESYITEDGGTSTAEHEPECTETFSKDFVCQFHDFVFLVDCYLC